MPKPQPDRSIRPLLVPKGLHRINPRGSPGREIRGYERQDGHR